MLLKGCNIIKYDRYLLALLIYCSIWFYVFFVQLKHRFFKLYTVLDFTGAPKPMCGAQEHVTSSKNATSSKARSP